MSEENNCPEDAEDRTPGIISWNELVTQDPEASKAFYSEMFGWEVETMPMPDGDYHMCSIGGRPVGGMVKPPRAEVPTMWNSYITVEDLDAAVAKAEGLGAHVCMPATDVPGKGRFAALTDPQGAPIALWQFV